MRRYVAGALCAGAVLLLAAPAQAHALLKRSDPANGAVLASPPHRITIEFTERPDPAVSVIRLVDSGGNAVPIGPTRGVAGQPRTLAVDITKTLPNDVYTVTWRTVSREDGHVTGGTFAFGVGRTPNAANTQSTPRGSARAPSPLSITARWLLYAGLAILLGAALTALVVVRDRLPSPVLLGGGAVAAAAGSLLRMLAEKNAVGIGLRDYLASAHGHLLLRASGFCLVAAVAAVVSSVWPTRWTYVALGVLAVAAIGAHAVTGHAGAAEHLRWPTVGVQWLHITSVTAWIGSLAWALVALPRDPEARAAAARRLSALATVAVIVVVATGTARAVAQIASWHLLVATDFGRVVLGKVAVFAVLLVLGGRNKLRLVPAASGDGPARRLRRAIAAEVAFGTVAFALTGVLAGLPPATAVSSARPPRTEPVVVTGNDYATSVRVRLTVTPGGVGPNTFTADVTDYDTGKPVEAQRVALRFSLPLRPDLRTSTLELTRAAGTARWSANGPNLSVDGRWHVVVVVDAGAAGVEVPLTVPTALPPETLREDRVPGQPTIYTATLPDGSTVQTYLDPDTAGFTEVHVTCFAPSGTERPLASLQVSVSRDDTTAPTKVRRFGPGHFVADTTLTAGRWHVAFRAVTADGAVLRGYADVDVRPKEGL